MSVGDLLGQANAGIGIGVYGAPVLRRQDVKAELAHIHQLEHHTLTTAIYGRWGDEAPATVQVEVAGPPRAPTAASVQGFVIRPVTCELQLREALLLDEPQALILDFTTELPADVLGRLAGRRLYYAAEDRRLGRKFGPHVLRASPELLRNRPLCQALLEDPEQEYGPAPGPVVGLDLAWRSLLWRWASFPMDSTLSLEGLVHFCASSKGGPEFARYLDGRKELRRELYAYLEASAGSLAALAWRAWERDEGRKVAALALILEAAGERLGESGYLRGSLVQLLERIEPGLGRGLSGAAPGPRAILRRWGEIAQPLSLRLEGRVYGEVLTTAESLLPDADAAAALAESPRLRQAYRHNQGVLAQLLRGQADRPTREGFTAACEVLGKLRRHEMSGGDVERTLVERAWMAVRLCGYLLCRPDIAGQSQDGALHEEIVRLAHHHATQGGFVDWARRVARGRQGSDDALEAAIERVVAAVDAVRDRDDERFAQGLARGASLSMHRGDGRAMPIQEVLERVAAGFVKGGEHRRLLVLLLDGMSWGQAVELVISLEGMQIAPLRWQPGRGEPGTLLPPVLAALPTLTEVSRAALFGGRVPRQGEPLDSGKDPDRFAEHAALYRATGQTPRLLIGADSQARAGDVTQEALELVGCLDRRVVGVVLNALDDQLHGSRQVRLRYTAETIKGLSALVQRAVEAERAILLLSDHGHVPGARMVSAGRRSGGGSRWRELAPGEEVAAGEVALGQADVWRPRGRERVALLYRETLCYGSSVAEGAHGGASLGEVVAPALLLGAEDLAGRTGGQDAELNVVPLPRPGWWDLDLTARPAVVARPAVAPTAPERPAGKGKAASPGVPSPQLALIPGELSGERASGSKVDEGRSEAEGVPAPQPTPWRDMLMASRVFKDLPRERKEQLRDVVAPRVELLASHQGRMAQDLFATRAGILPGRVGGLVAVLEEWLNLDGYRVVYQDRSAKQVVLELQLLRDLFSEG